MRGRNVYEIHEGEDAFHHWITYRDKALINLQAKISFLSFI